MISGATSVPTPPQSPTSLHFKSSPSSSATLGNSNNGNGSSTLIALGPHIGSSASPPPDNPVNPSSNAITTTASTPMLRSLLTQPVTRAVIILTIVHSLVALGGRFPGHCIAPSHVLYAGQYLALVASPFIVPLSPMLLASSQQTLGTAMLLGTSNILSLALFEDRLTAIFGRGGTRIFRCLFLAILGLVLGLRQVLGFVFSRSVGWTVPALFFSDSMHECNLGLAPFLFALLVVQALFPESSSQSLHSTSFLSIRRIHLQAILCLFNVIPKTIVWWAGSGLIIGFFVSLFVSYQRRMGRWGGKVKTSTIERHSWEEAGLILEKGHKENNGAGYFKELESGLSTPTGTQAEGASLARERMITYTFWKAITYILPVIVVLTLTLVGCNQLHTYRPDISNRVLSGSIEPQTPYLLTLVMMTAPRRNDITYIKQTLTSYLDNFPDETVDPLYSRIQIVVYTHFTDFEGFDQTKAYFDTIPKARKHVKWIREEGSEKNQRKHLISAIRKVGTTEDTVYLGIMEDDFPFCKGGWQEMLNTIYEANRRVQDHCGIFVATGGSGLIFKRSMALTASFILENDVRAYEQGERVPPPDISLQDCMLGKHDYCTSCAGTMVISKTLLQGHLGYNSSTSGDGYNHNQFQCGWRHPFNGSPVVHAM
ncbi:hypothetical protein BGZ50_006432 [Haplosporangium sp. Z 11]|nr:hypothetical protein BGZ50_006432 [Haplosporangium sp. Z 11]